MNAGVPRVRPRRVRRRAARTAHGGRSASLSTDERHAARRRRVGGGRSRAPFGGRLLPVRRRRSATRPSSPCGSRCSQGLGWCERFLERRPREHFRAWVRGLLVAGDRTDRLGAAARASRDLDGAAPRHAVRRRSASSAPSPRPSALAREIERRGARRGRRSIRRSRRPRSRSSRPAGGGRRSTRPSSRRRTSAPTPQEQLRYLYALPDFRDAGADRPHASSSTLTERGPPAERARACSRARSANRDQGDRAWAVREGALGRDRRAPARPRRSCTSADGVRFLTDPESWSRTPRRSSPSTRSRSRRSSSEQILERQRVVRAHRGAGDPGALADVLRRPELGQLRPIRRRVRVRAADEHHDALARVGARTRPDRSAASAAAPPGSATTRSSLPEAALRVADRVVGHQDDAARRTRDASRTRSRPPAWPRASPPRARRRRRRRAARRARASEIVGHWSGSTPTTRTSALVPRRDRRRSGRRRRSRPARCRRRGPARESSTADRALAGDDLGLVVRVQDEGAGLGRARSALASSASS